MRHGEGVIDIRSPLFDYLRQPSSAPMRVFYASAYTECLKLCGVNGVVEVDEAHTGCRLKLTVRGPGPDAPAFGAARMMPGVAAGSWPARCRRHRPTRPRLPQAGAVLVLPFDNPGGHPRVLWLREGLATLVSDALEAADFEVVGRDDRVARVRATATAGRRNAQPRLHDQSGHGRRRHRDRRRAHRARGRGADRHDPGRAPGQRPPAARCRGARAVRRGVFARGPGGGTPGGPRWCAALAAAAVARRRSSCTRKDSSRILPPPSAPSSNRR